MIDSTSNFWKRPKTKSGWWAVGLLIAFIVMFNINSLVFMRLQGNAPWQHNLLPFYGIFMLLCGLTSGVIGLIAILRNHERSWMVWVTLLPGIFVLFLLLGELIIPH